MLQSDFSLLDKTKNAADIDTSTFKVFLHGILGVLVATATGYFLENFINQKAAGDLLWVIVCSFVFVLLFLFQRLFIKSDAIVSTIVLLESLGFASFFMVAGWRENPYLIASAWFAMLYFLWMTSNKTRKVFKNQIEVHLMEISRKAIPGAITAITIFVSIIISGSLYSTDQIISGSQLKRIIGPVEPLARKYVVSNFSLDMTMAQFTESSLISKFTPEQQAALERSPANKKALIDKAFAALREQGKNIGMEISPEKTMITTLADFVNQKILSFKLPDDFPLNVKVLFLILVGLFIFFTIKGLASLIQWFIYLIASLIFEIMIALGYIHITLQSQSKEIIIL